MPSSRRTAAALRQPPLDGLAGGGEQVVVPAGRPDARAVARGVGQPPVGPRHPGQGGLHLRQAAQQPVVRGRGRQVPQGRHVPGAADHRDPLEAVPDRPAQHPAHVRLADGVARIGFPGVGAEDPDGLGQCVEDRGPKDMFHHILQQRSGRRGARVASSSTDQRAASAARDHRGGLVHDWRVAERPDPDTHAQRVRRVACPTPAGTPRRRRPACSASQQLPSSATSGRGWASTSSVTSPIRLQRPLDASTTSSVFRPARPTRRRRTRPVIRISSGADGGSSCRRGRGACPTAAPFRLLIRRRTRQGSRGPLQ